MKKILVIVIFSFGALAVKGQGLEVLDTPGLYQGIVGQEFRVPLKVKNTGSQTVLLRLVEEERQIGTSQKLYYCYGQTCDRDNVALRQAGPPRQVLKLLPGQTTNFYELVLEAGLVPGESQVVVRLENAANPQEYARFDLRFEIADLPGEGLLYFSKTLELSDVYPNPARDVAIFDYRIKDDSKEAKIIIHNVLGSVAGEYQLNPYETQLKISVEQLNPGVYFYSLYIDNEGVATKKLVVRR